jgi:hypothetical protein
VKYMENWSMLQEDLTSSPCNKIMHLSIKIILRPNSWNIASNFSPDFDIL